MLNSAFSTVIAVPHGKEKKRPSRLTRNDVDRDVADNFSDEESLTTSGRMVSECAAIGETVNTGDAGCITGPPTERL